MFGPVVFLSLAVILDVDDKSNRREPRYLVGAQRALLAHQYMRYLEDIYGRPVHKLHEIPGVGHNASAMFGSEIGLRELFN